MRSRTDRDWAPRCALALLAAVLANAHAQAATLELDRDAQARIGLRTAPLKAATGGAMQEAAALVLDPTPLIRLNAELTAALASAAASAAEAERAQKLVQQDSAVSQRALEAARAQAATDSGKVAALRAELRAGWGALLAEQPAAERSAALEALARGESVLLRIELLGGMPSSTPSQAWLVGPVGGERRAQILGRFQQPGTGIVPGWLARAPGAGLAPGMGLAARLQVPAQGGAAGLLLPRSALIRWNGLQYVYVAVDDEHFERRAVTDAQAAPDGWRVSTGFSAGEAVVVQGAASLLGAETLPHEEEPQDDKKGAGADKAPAGKD